MLNTMVLGEKVMFDEHGVFYTKSSKVCNVLMDAYGKKIKFPGGLYSYLNTASEYHIVQLCFYVDKKFKLYTEDEELLKYRRELIFNHNNGKKIK